MNLRNRRTAALLALGLSGVLLAAGCSSTAKKTTIRVRRLSKDSFKRLLYDSFSGRFMQGDADLGGKEQ